MLASLLRAAVLAVVAVALWVTVLAGQRGQWGAGLAIAALLGLAVVPVLAIEMLAMHWVNRRARGLLPGHERHVGVPPPPTLAGLIGAWWREVLTFYAVFAWRQPFWSRRVADIPANTRPLPGQGVHAPRGVLLVHGYSCNRGLWNPWLERLRAKAIPCEAIDLEPVFGSIDDHAPAIEAAVRRLTASTGRRPVLVGHSMGGLALRAWCRHAGPGALARVHRIVTLGSPHHGTWLARFGHTTNARQMRLHSAWLQALAAAESAALHGRFVCYWSHCDNIVFPASSATLPGADNRHILHTAHVELINVPEVIAQVVGLASQDEAELGTVEANAGAERPPAAQDRTAR